MQACARIYVEVDLGKGLPEAIKLKVDDWVHIQQLDYEQIPFKCKICHEYGHFANRCTKLIDVENTSQEEQWEKKKKSKAAPNPKPNPEVGPSSRPPPSPPSSSSLPSLKPNRQPDPQPFSPSSNPFHILSTPEDIPTPAIQSDPSESPLPLINSSSFPPDPPPPKITRSNSKEHGATLDNQKKPGRKSAKQHRDENAQKDIAMGIQNPIESYILGQIDKDLVNKDQGGRATPRNPHLN